MNGVATASARKYGNMYKAVIKMPNKMNTFTLKGLYKSRADASTEAQKYIDNSLVSALETYEKFGPSPYIIECIKIWGGSTCLMNDH